MGRGKAYTDAQVLVIQTEYKAGCRSRKILSKHPNLGFTRRGIRNVLDKLKESPDTGPTVGKNNFLSSLWPKKNHAVRIVFFGPPCMCTVYYGDYSIIHMLGPKKD